MATREYKIRFKKSDTVSYVYYLYDDDSIEYEGTDPKMTEAEWVRKFALIKYVTEYMKLYPKRSIEIEKL